MDARAALESIADFIEARSNVFELDDETQESMLNDIANRFKTAISAK